MVLRAESLSFRYPEAEGFALENINLQVRQGEFLGITGASGAGKTTLCSALCGAIPHLILGEMRGRVLISDKDTSQTPIAELTKEVGVVLADPEAQLFSLSVFADVTFGPENLRLPREEIIRRAEWALNVVGMYEFKDRPSGSLSGGQKQRVAIACTLAMGSNIIVLDEPTSELDPIGTEEVFTVLKQLNDSGVTVVVAEQKVEELAKVIHRLVYIQSGRILFDLPSRDFFLATRDDYLQGKADVFMPQVTQLAHELYRSGVPLNSIPITIEEFLAELSTLKRGMSSARR